MFCDVSLESGEKVTEMMFVKLCGFETLWLMIQIWTILITLFATKTLSHKETKIN
jgi:hypothetical protein